MQKISSIPEKAKVPKKDVRRLLQNASNCKNSTRLRLKPKGSNTYSKIMLSAECEKIDSMMRVV